MRAAPRAADVRLEQIPHSGARSYRRPMHPFRLKVSPFTITPSYIAPILAGDTLVNANIQFRGMTSPSDQDGLIQSNLLTGWWIEHYVWFVRVGDLLDADTVRAAIVDPSQNMDALASAANTLYMHQVATRPSWVKECLRQVTYHYFREEGEDWDAYTLQGHDQATALPAVQITGRSWMDSVVPSSDITTDGGDTDDWERTWTAYQQLRNARLTVATWEEYLAINGVSSPAVLRETEQDKKKPELLRFVRQFVYPRSVVDPNAGSVAGSLDVNIAERIDKRRRFDQPGFIFGATVLRPKVYLGNQRTTGVDVMLHNAEGWMPAEYETDPHTRLVEFQDNGGSGAGTGPIHGATVDYWVDRGDLFLYGDQFVNFDVTGPAPAIPSVALPEPDGSPRKYPDQADQTALWTVLHIDGIVSFNIASRISRDATAGGSL